MTHSEQLLSFNFSFSFHGLRILLVKPRIQSRQRRLMGVPLGRGQRLSGTITTIIESLNLLQSNFPYESLKVGHCSQTSPGWGESHP